MAYFMILKIDFKRLKHKVYGFTNRLHCCCTICSYSNTLSYRILPHGNTPIKTARKQPHRKP